jgi:hypothetical protein
MDIDRESHPFWNNRKARANYEHVEFEGPPGVIFIRDLDQGGVSVTNDAEAVVEEVHKYYPGKRIVYRDSHGDWDELMHAAGKFTGFALYKGPTPT